MQTDYIVFFCLFPLFLRYDVTTIACLGYCLSTKVTRASAKGAKPTTTKKNLPAKKKVDEKPKMSATHNARWDFVSRNNLG